MNSTEVVLKMIFDRWNTSIKNCDSLLNTLTDEQLQKEITAGKNRGVYLLGHLIAVHDDMLVLLGLGEKLYPEWRNAFLESPDKTVAEMPSVKELRAGWNAQCEVLQQRMEKLPAGEWFEKHTAVADEDFIKEPHRNKLNIILTRTTHLQYHIGQLILLK